jgi:uncharacterized membrane protein (UPF0127 family)
VTRRAVLLLLVATILACTMKPGSPKSSARRSGVRLVVVPADAKRPAVETPVVFVEIAATNDARNRGLGGRDRLGPDAGMLFVYGTPDFRTYWMKDCLIGLDIAFIGPDRRIMNVVTLPAAAGLPDAKVPRANSVGPGPWVLETAAGWLDAHDVAAGDEVDLSAALVGVVPR